MHAHIYLYTYLFIYLFTNPSAQAGYDTRSVFSRVYRFEFRVFLLLERLPLQGYRVQSTLIFTHIFYYTMIN